jgi:uncharacterized protein (TIGR02145 family)
MKKIKWLFGILIFFLTVFISCTKKNNDDLIPKVISGKPVSDIEGNVYATVIIGTQTWMAENLKTTKYNDGTLIPYGFNSSTGTYLWYNNDTVNKKTYGAMYNWYVAISNVCPSGWHVPNVTEWTTLADYVGGWSVSITKLQEAGFAPLPAGLNYDGPNMPYMNMGSYGWWWTSSDLNGGYRGWYVEYDGINNDLGAGNDCKWFHFSVRCIKNNQ